MLNFFSSEYNPATQSNQFTTIISHPTSSATGNLGSQRDLDSTPTPKHLEGWHKSAKHIISGRLAYAKLNQQLNPTRTFTHFYVSETSLLQGFTYIQRGNWPDKLGNFAHSSSLYEPYMDLFCCLSQELKNSLYFDALGCIFMHHL